MLNALDNLPEDPVELRRVTELLASEVKAQALMIEKLQHQLHGANRHRFGSKSEGMDQLQLFAENEEIAEAAVKAAETAPAEPIELKEKPRRKPLPDHLERIEQVLSVGEDCPECGGDLSKPGEDITEELEYIPGRFVVNKITRPRMACRRCEAISQAPMPSRPIERGRPGPGLLAHVLVSRFADHLPLYRQSQIYAREGVDLDRSTMADWVGKSTGLLEPLAEAIAKRAKGGTSLFADDTPLKMLAPGNKKTRTARIRAYVRDERPWSGPCATGAQTDNLSSCAGRAPSLLTSLAFNSTVPLAGVNWGDKETLTKLRIADFACGTGTLLSSAYQRIGQLHELDGGDVEALHPQLMANTFVGCDVLPSAAHLTASMLSGIIPQLRRKKFNSDRCVVSVRWLHFRAVIPRHQLV